MNLISPLSRRQALRGLGLAGAAAALLPRGTARSQATVPPVPPKPTAPAANVAAVAPAVYRFAIGDFEAVAISDGFATAAAPLQPMWAPQAKPAEFEAALQDQFLPTDRIEMAFNVLLVRTGKETVLVDTGSGTLYAPTTGRLLTGLTAAGMRPEDITAVILTHAHVDHFGGLLDAAGRPTFARAQHFVSVPEFDFWTAANPDLSDSRAPAETRKSFIAGAQKHLLTLRDQFKRIEPGKPGALPDGFEGILSPGHTAGHLPLRIRSAGQELLHIADTAHHFALMLPHPDWTVAFDADEAQAAASRRKLLETAAAGRTRVFGYHLPFPGLGHLRSDGQGGFPWAPEPWSQAPVRAA